MLDHLQTVIDQENRASLNKWANKLLLNYVKGLRFDDSNALIVSLCVIFGTLGFVAGKFANEPHVGSRVTNIIQTLFRVTSYDDFH